MSKSKSNQNAAASSKSASPSNTRQPRQRMVQNYLLLWLDNSTGQTNEDYENTLEQIQTVTGDVNVFKQRDACVDFLTDTQEDIKSFLVVKDTMFQQIMPLINDISQLEGVYIFNDIKILHEEWIQEWQKIKSVHTNIDDLCQRLKVGVRQYNQDSIAVSFVPVNEIVSTDNLNQLEPTFMYTQIFKDILLDMEHDKQAITNFTTYCRKNNSGWLVNIQRFEKEYHTQSAVWWYTCPTFIFGMLNYALRSMDGDTIINMGFFIHDLHQQIQQLHQQQLSTYHDKPFIVYRGQGLSIANFEKLQKTRGGLMSFNNFLSTSSARQISLEYAYTASTTTDMVGILFIMSIDPNIKSVPFASVEHISYYQDEDELLFSMHTVFRVGTIQQMHINNQLYQVELQLTSDDDQQLRVLTDRIREEASGSTGWRRLGKLLLKIGQFNKAEELYNVLLEQTSDEGEKAYYYHKLGAVHYNQSNYEKAISYYEQGLEVQKKTLPTNHSDLAESFNDIGLVYDSIGEYSKALSSHEKALDIWQKTLPSNDPLLATSYNNIGNVYDSLGEYSKALSSHVKALEIRQKTLSSNHPDLAISYGNIGLVYRKMGEYSKALSFYEKALEIQEKTLPSNHPDLAILYNNIGLVYITMEEYSKALSSHEKALEIQQKTLPSNHSDLAISNNNIGGVYYEMKEYSKALLSHEKALEIYQKTLPTNHPHLATSYNNIGSVYSEMREYSKALSYYGKALEIRQKTLSSNHPLLATSYKNIGLVYKNMGEYSKALSFYEKALEIQQKTLPSNHPELAIPFNNIGFLYENMKDYSKALSYFQRALDIFQRALSPTHPNIENVKESIEIVRKKL
ncbi:unnamed protein product [Adineta steineri]|uniref:ADP ribosyltransferase domain-containing protein n=1 Tax=Adineta steineri TaxID=433720 RepID=A0A819JTI6_9BILA|nr:unnamed protein product [Adineta steineri]CAF3938092.1 unnamed protein product [Adineta steineri]